MNRRSLLASLAIAPTAALASSPKAQVPPELVAAANAYVAAIEHTITTEANEDPWSEESEELSHAEAEYRAAHDRLYDLMNALDVAVFVAGGRLFVNEWRNITENCEAILSTYLPVALAFDLNRVMGL